MHNLKTVIWFEFSRTVKKKSFWVSILIFPLLITLIGFISYFSSKSAINAGAQLNQEHFSVTVLDESKLVSPEALKSVQAIDAQSKDAGIAAVRSGAVDAFIYYPKDPAKNAVEVYAKNAGITKNSKYTSVAEQLLKSSIIAQIGSEQKAGIIQNGVQTNLTTYDQGKETGNIANTLAPGIFIILFYLTIMLLGNQMLSSVTEEKENRVIEMILTSIKARTLIVGKILTITLLGIVQIVLTLLPFIIALSFFPAQLHLPFIDLSQINLLSGAMLIGLVLFGLSFILFTGVLVTIGAMTPTAKEAGRFLGLAMFFMIAPIYALQAIMSDPNQAIVKVFSFFPLTAPITLMLRNTVGNLGQSEIIVGITILALSGIIALTTAVRAFRFGALEYDRKLNLKELFKKGSH